MNADSPLPQNGEACGCDPDLVRHFGCHNIFGHARRGDVRCLVSGGRDFEDREHAFVMLDSVDRAYGITEIVVGDCPTGADRWAREWAKERGKSLSVFRADWNRHGRAAGPKRNEEMAEYGADYAVFFPGGRGTADMYRRAKKRGIDIAYAYGQTA